MVFQSTSSFHFVHRFARIFPVLPTIDFNFITKLITILNPVVVNCCASNMGHSNDIVYVSQCESELGFRKAGSGERRKSLQCSVPILLGERKNPIVFVYAFFFSSFSSFSSQRFHNSCIRIQYNKPYHMQQQCVLFGVFVLYGYTNNLQWKRVKYEGFLMLK